MNQSKPNFLVFCLDQIGASAFSCYGNPDSRTPNIDRLASQSVRCDRAYCNSPVCMPSRATLLSGLSPRQHGCVTNGVPLPEDVPTVTQCLGDRGYRTHAVGKLHLQPGLDGGDREPLSEFSCEDKIRWENGEIAGLPEGYYGFQTTDYVNGHVSGCYGDYANEIECSHPGLLELYGKEKGRLCPGNLICWRSEMPADLHYNRWIADKTSAFIHRSSEVANPFFVWSSFPDPHGPWAAAKEYTDRFDPDSLSLNPTWQDTKDPLPRLAAERERLISFLKVPDRATLSEVTAQTYAMMEHIDENIGRVLNALEESGEAENTVIVLLADHGEYLGSHGLLGKTPWPYEELLRIPMLWSLPEHRRGDETLASLPSLVSTLDFVPTILDLAGAAPDALFHRGNAKADFRLPGKSLLPQLRGGRADPDRAVLCEFDNGMKAGPIVRTRTLVTQRWKLSLFAGEGGGILFDLENDPHERINLWDDVQMRSVRANLTEQLLREIIASDRFALPRWIGA